MDGGYLRIFNIAGMPWFPESEALADYAGRGDATTTFTTFFECF